MNEEALDALNGQIQGLALVISAITLNLDPQQAHRASVQLQASLDIENEQASAPRSAANRNSIATAFLDQLRSVASRG